MVRKPHVRYGSGTSRPSRIVSRRSNGSILHTADPAHPLMARLGLVSRKTILLDKPLRRPPCLRAQSLTQYIGAVGNVHYCAGKAAFITCMFWEGEKRGAPGPTGDIHKMPSWDPPVNYRDLPSAAFDQTGTFKLPGGIRDGWPLDAQHFGEQVLSDRKTSSSPRSRIISSQHANRCLRLCAPLHATDTMNCSRKAGRKRP